MIGLHIPIVHSPKCITERKDPRMGFNKNGWLGKWNAESRCIVEIHGVHHTK